MKRLSSTALLSFLFLFSTLQAQMIINGQTLYGNEWINHSQDYYKLYVHEDGMYRISQQALVDAGVPVGAINSGDFQLYAMGNQVPIYASTGGSLGSSDYIEFYGEENLGEMDKHLYPSPDDIFNPYFSMFTDTTTYFLTWGSGSNNHIQDAPNNLAGLPAAEPYFMDQAVETFTLSQKKYNKGEPYGGLYESRFSAGEGFGYKLNQTTPGSVTISDLYTGGPDAQLSVRLASSGAGTNHHLQISLNGAAVAIDSATFYNYVHRQVDENISTSTLNNGANALEVKGLLGSSDKYATSFMRITYPRQFSFGNADNFKFNVPADPSNKKYLEITNFNHGGVAPILYDLTNGLRITTALSGSTVRVALPPSADDRELILVSENHTRTMLEPNEVSFVDYSASANQGDYIIISNPLLMDDGAGNNYVQQYADYRNSTGYQTVLITTEQLYDQFAYGISRHSQSVRNLTGYSLANWTPRPRYMFMIGKSRPYYSVRKNWNKQPAFTTTFGHEPSDMLLTATIQSDAPRLAFGKLPVTTTEQIATYLNKIMIYENTNTTLPQTIEEKEWRKRVIHMGGGDQNIQPTIINNLSNYESQISDEYYGANVESFIQNSSEPTIGSASQRLDSLIAEGASLLTFYGHSTPNNIDFNLKLPGEYDNVNKFPVFFSLGCYNGQIHTKTFGMSEQFVFEPDRGTIAFMATIGLSSLGALDVFADAFYLKMSKDNYGEGIGDIAQATVASLSEDLNVYNRIVYQQMTVNGDPAIRINNDIAPDYTVRESAFDFGAEEPKSSEEIELSFNLVNLGRTDNTQIRVLIERVLPDGTTVTVLSDLVDAPAFEETFTYSIPPILDAVGINEFIVTVDSDNVVVELPDPTAENNNTGSATVLVYADVVTPISPTDYSIQPDANDITLQAQINAPYTNQNLTYYIEIDTTENYNSPLYQSTSIQQTGGVLTWAPPVSYTNETVYYWRVRVEAADVPNAAGWQNMSYVYIDGEYPGWNQSHHYQFLDDRYPNTLVYNEDTREFEFISGGIEVIVNNAHYGVLDDSKIVYSIAGERIYDMEPCEQNLQGVYIALIDENGDPIWNDQVNAANDVGQYGTFLCANTRPAYTFLTDTPAGQQNLQNFLNNTLPTLTDVHDVIIYTMNDYQPETWNQSLFDAFGNYGINELQNSASLGGVPYAALIDLENNIAQEEIGASEGDIIEGLFAIDEPWYEGTMSSTIIGPASEWGSLQWGTIGQEDHDIAYVNVYGIDANGNRSTQPIISQITADELIFEQNNAIDAAQYPYIQLEYYTSDEVNNTPTQLDFWRIIYEDSPCYQLNITAMLEGPYDSASGDMATTLSIDRKILPGQTPISPLVPPTPAGQPYSVAPWNHTGSEGIGFTDANYTGNEVDWVLVSVRTATAKVSEEAAAAGLLMKDGTINFSSECPLETTHPGPFYIVVEHRNHMGIMTPQPIEVVNKELIYNFTTQDSYRDAAGTGVGQKEIAPGVWVMLSGDLGQTNDAGSYDITGADKIIWADGNGNFDSYRYSDANLNGDTNGSDKIYWEINNGKSSRVPR